MNTLMLIPILLICGVLLLLIYRLYVLETNFASYIDFSDEKISELEAKASQLEAYNSNMNDVIEGDLAKLLTWIQLQLDSLKLEYENHNLRYFHMDENYALVRPEAVLEQEMTLIQLEQEIVKTSKRLGIEHKIKPRRPEGL